MYLLTDKLLFPNQTVPNAPLKQLQAQCEDILYQATFYTFKVHLPAFSPTVGLYPIRAELRLSSSPYLLIADLHLLQGDKGTLM